MSEHGSDVTSGVEPGSSAAPPLVPDDPYAQLDDLTCVIEALCPIWPHRPVTTMTVFLL